MEEAAIHRRANFARRSNVPWKSYKLISMPEYKRSTYNERIRGGDAMAPMQTWVKSVSIAKEKILAGQYIHKARCLSDEVFDLYI